jgi:hypothetical protein
MTGSVPPRLLGPRLAVWASFPFDGRSVAPSGAPPQPADWPWALSQWERVASAGATVRLVVADQAYSQFDETTTVGRSSRDGLMARFDACRANGQLVFGRVYVAGGKLLLGSAGQRFDDPLRPGHQIGGVATQIDAWRRLYGDRIDGIYLDSGPSDCTDPAIPGSDPAVPGNYNAYVSFVRMLGYKLFVQAVAYPDSRPGLPWLQNLNADFLEVWEAGVAPYVNKFTARDACRPERPPSIPSWWDPGPADRWRRVHVINDCRNAESLRKMGDLATGARNAGNVWITLPRLDPDLGAVYDVLPGYWDEEVAYFDTFRRRDEDAAKEAKDGKDVPDQESKDAKDTKDQPDKDQKDSKDAKDAPDDAAQWSKDTKDDKDGKDVPDKPKEEDEGPPPPTEKQEKDGKDFKDGQDNPKIPDILKDSEALAKTLEMAGNAFAPHDLPEPDPDDPSTGRTFIRPGERPSVGEQIVADPPDELR